MCIFPFWYLNMLLDNGLPVLRSCKWRRVLVNCSAAVYLASGTAIPRQQIQLSRPGIYTSSFCSSSANRINTHLFTHLATVPSTTFRNWKHIYMYPSRRECAIDNLQRWKKYNRREETVSIVYVWKQIIVLWKKN